MNFLCSSTPFAGLISQAESLFFYPAGRTQSDFVQPNFRPAFADQSLDNQLENTDPTFAAQVRQACGESTACLFDAVITRNVEVARVTRETESTQDVLRNISRPGEILVDSLSFSSFFNVLSLFSIELVKHNCLSKISRFKKCFPGFRFHSNFIETPHKYVCYVEEHIFF